MKSCSVAGCDNKYRAIGYCGTHWKIFKKYGSALPTCWCGELSHTFAGNRGGSTLCKQHSLLERFWQNVDVKSIDDCWEWTAARTAAGYGVIYWNGVNTFAHRLSLEFDGRAVPPRFHACHKCDNPCCVNPNHLFVGSPRDNMLDKVAKGRHTYGETHYASKLSSEDVIAIREMATENVIFADIARQFGIGRSYVGEIVAGKTRIRG